MIFGDNTLFPLTDPAALIFFAGILLEIAIVCTICWLEGNDR